MPATNPLLDDLGLDLDELDLGDGSIDEMVAELEDFFDDSDPEPHTEVKVSKPPNCDLCEKVENKKTPALYDGKTTLGPWGFLCQKHFNQFGIGLGLGRGQKLLADEAEGQSCG